MQESVNLFLSRTVKDSSNLELIVPVIPEKSLLAQIADMLQVKYYLILIKIFVNRQ